MALVKWFRKNNAKIMAVVVVFLMIAFLMPTTLKQLGRHGSAERKAIATTRDNRKITNYDLGDARRELELLKLLRADALLLSTKDLRSILLCELLFFEQRVAPLVANRIKTLIRDNQCRISNKQINDIYKHPRDSEVYWLLLKEEAERAGIRVSNQQSGGFLEKMAPQLFSGATFTQVMETVMSQHGVSENEILAAFGSLLSVLDYTKLICSNENMTIRQIMHNASEKSETAETELVKFDSAIFAADQPTPTEQQMTEQFDKYKGLFAGAVSKENPYGFGYKLPDRVALEYVALKLNDVSGTVTAISEEETEEYYRRNLRQFTTSEPSDPNDPNSPTIEKTKSYAEVANVLSKELQQDRINAEAEKIFQDVKMHTEAGLEKANVETSALSGEQFKKMAGDYKTAADEISKKYKIKVYTGQTGLLSAADFQVNAILGLSYIMGHGYNPVRLSRIVFAVEGLNASELGPLDVPKPRPYENIGPTKDMFGKIMMLVRVTKAEKACEPENTNVSYDKKPVRLDDANSPQAKPDIYSVRETVAEDLKKLAAMQTAKNKAEEFIRLAAKDGWENTANKFNKLYEGQSTQNAAEPNAFKVQKLTGLQRISDADLQTLAAQNDGDPYADFLAAQNKKESLLISRLYNLIPQDSNAISAPLVMEFEPQMCCYAVKKLFVTRLNEADYEKIKNLLAYGENFAESQNLAAVYLNPENILKRAGFKPAKETETAAEPNTSAKPQGASQ